MPPTKLFYAMAVAPAEVIVRGRRVSFSPNDRIGPLTAEETAAVKQSPDSKHLLFTEIEVKTDSNQEFVQVNPKQGVSFSNLSEIKDEAVSSPLKNTVDDVIPDVNTEDTDALVSLLVSESVESFPPSVITSDEEFQKLPPELPVNDIRESGGQEIILDEPLVPDEPKKRTRRRS